MKRVDPFKNNSCLPEGTNVAENLYELKYGALEYSDIVSFVFVYILSSLNTLLVLLLITFLKLTSLLF